MISGSSCKALGRGAACFFLLLHLYFVQGVFNLYLPSFSKAEGSCGVILAETKPVFLELVQVSAS